MFGSQARPGMGLGSLGDDSLGAAGGRKYHLEPLGASATPSLISAYGQTVARAIMTRVGSMPDALRATTAKQAMNEIDPTLYSRADKLAAAARGRGMSARDALAHGIAVAASQGMLSELAKVGRGNLAPLSGDPTMAMMALQTGALQKSAVSTTKGGQYAAAPEQQICVRPGYTFMGDRWERIAPGADINGGNPGYTVNGQCLPTEIRTHERAPDVVRTPEEQAKYDAAAAAAAARHAADEARLQPVTGSLEGKFLSIGPFTLPYAKQIGIHQTMNAEQAKYVQDRISVAVSASGTDNVSMQMMAAGMSKGTIPFAKFTRPNEPADPYRGKPFGLYFKKDPDGKTYLLYREYVPQDNLFEVAWKVIKPIVVHVIEVVQAIRGAIHEAVCNFANKPGAVEASTSTGNPYVVAGTVVAKGVCPKPKPEDMPGGGDATSSSNLPYFIAGGAGLLIILAAVTRKPKGK